MKTKPHPADALDAMLESLAVQNERQPDEFTINDMLERLSSEGRHSTRSCLRDKLSRGVREGVYEMRVIPINGKRTNVYRVK